ncbi:MAG: hypothetical protein OQJ97_06560 [Rhodospirillales bacterium]|nr:hypothetical protein [Rhodospirillales bacterium]
MPWERRKISSTPFTSAERKRFRNLLELAKSSPFPGEQANALTAAKRMASKNGMTLEEAAAAQPPEPAQVPQNPKRTRKDDIQVKEFVKYADLMDYQLRMEKLQREHAFNAARMRGLDADADKAKAAQQKRFASTIRKSKSNVRMEPEKYAEVLLKETAFPIHEIADLSGLDIYKVVTLKLKMRK